MDLRAFARRLERRARRAFNAMRTEVILHSDLALAALLIESFLLGALGVYLIAGGPCA